MEEKHKGLINIEVIKDDPIFGGKSSFEAYENHTWKINELPDCFVPLAKSEHSYEVVKHKELPIYGLQFHPENMVDKTDGDQIFLNLFNMLN